MKITRKQIEDALEFVFLPQKGQSTIKNIQIFDNEIIIDLEVNNPTLQFKNKIEKDCSDALKKKFSSNLKLKMNFIFKKKETIDDSKIPGIKNIIAVSSAKGGVGKSTLTSNIAVGLSVLGNKVGILDADIYGPSMPIMFNLEGYTPQAVNVNGKNKMKPPSNYNIKIASIGFFAKPNQALVWRGPMASKALNQLLKDTYWGELDYLIVDLPPGTGDIHLSLLQAIPLTGAVIVSTPQYVALADAKKGVEMFKMESINVPILGFIENMSYFIPEDDKKKKYYIFGRDGVKKLAEQINIDFLSEIPIVKSLREAGDAGRPVILQKDSEIAKTFLNLSSLIIDKVNQRNKDLEPTTSVKITHTKGCSK